MVKLKPKEINITSTHFRLGWEPSPDNPGMVRYHAISVDHSRIAVEARMHRFEEELSKISPVNVIRQARTGKVKDSDLEYAFQSFDCKVAPPEINLSKIGKNIIRDYRLCERIAEGTSIDRYVESIYSN